MKLDCKLTWRRVTDAGFLIWIEKIRKTVIAPKEQLYEKIVVIIVMDAHLGGVSLSFIKVLKEKFGNLYSLNFVTEE